MIRRIGGVFFMRLIVLGLSLIALTGAAAAQTSAPAAPAVLDQVYACADVAGEAERLSCYDAAVGRLRAAQSSGELLAVDRSQAEEIERDAFGFSLPSLPRLFGRNDSQDEPAVAEIESEITRIGAGGEGRPVFHLANGQSWAQLDSAPSRAARVGVAVTVQRAAMGSFLMHVATGGPALRVRRVG
jgi:hypothetical protein